MRASDYFDHEYLVPFFDNTSNKFVPVIEDTVTWVISESGTIVEELEDNHGTMYMLQRGWNSIFVFKSTDECKVFLGITERVQYSSGMRPDISKFKCAFLVHKTYGDAYLQAKTTGSSIYRMRSILGYRKEMLSDSYGSSPDWEWDEWCFNCLQKWENAERLSLDEIDGICSTIVNHPATQSYYATEHGKRVYMLTMPANLEAYPSVSSITFELEVWGCYEYSYISIYCSEGKLFRLNFEKGTVEKFMGMTRGDLYALLTGRKVAAKTSKDLCTTLGSEPEDLGAISEMMELDV